MTPADYAGMVQYIAVRWGDASLWESGAETLYHEEFADLDSENVWQALNDYLDDPEFAHWTPKPPDIRLRAKVIARDRVDPTRALPSSVEEAPGMGWGEWCVEVFGEVRRADEVIRERHRELVGSLVTVTEARFPWEARLLAEGIVPRIPCLVPDCDVHPKPWLHLRDGKWQWRPDGKRWTEWHPDIYGRTPLPDLPGILG
jgi:hypothetical protein